MNGIVLQIKDTLDMRDKKNMLVHMWHEYLVDGNVYDILELVLNRSTTLILVASDCDDTSHEYGMPLVH